MIRTVLRQPDGRRVYLYGEFSPAPVGYQAPTIGEGAYQQRWSALRKEWVLVAAARQGRTFLPKRADCPLCPSTAAYSTEIPATRFQVAVFENRFPAMLSGTALVAASRHARPSAGACEVVVYTDQHDGSFGSLPAARLDQLVDVWTDRYVDLSARRDVRYVFLFENRGEAVGVTLHHPHGQIYAYPFVPRLAAAELGGRSCLLCEMVSAELADRRRVVFSEAGTVAYIPEAARWPYEAHVVMRAHRGALPDLRPEGRRAFIRALQLVARAYDGLFGVLMPYMMVLHQRPTDAGRYPQAHLHAEFYPLLRDRDKLKYLAGSESGAGVFVNDSLAEESAARLRAALRR